MEVQLPFVTTVELRPSDVATDVATPGVGQGARLHVVGARKGQTRRSAQIRPRRTHTFQVA